MEKVKQFTTKNGSKGRLVTESAPEAIILPPHVLQKQCEEWAERVRDGVNSTLGRDRLSIGMFNNNEDGSVDIIMRDEDKPDGWDRLYVGWEQGCDVDATVEMLLNGQTNEAKA